MSGVCEKPRALFRDVNVTPELVRSFNNGNFSEVEVIVGHVRMYNLDVTDLSFLRNVEMIGGHLEIHSHGTSLSGLDSLVTIGGYVSALVFRGANVPSNIRDATNDCRNC